MLIKAIHATANLCYYYEPRKLGCSMVSVQSVYRKHVLAHGFYCVLILIGEPGDPVNVIQELRADTY